MLFYDFEVFQYDWLVVIKDTRKQETITIINDAEKLNKVYEQNKNDIWIGYNSRSYDSYILKAIICGFNPKSMNDHIILNKQNGYSFSSLVNKIELYNYDVMTSPHSLKQLEGFMGNDIRETTVPFDIDRKLTDEELQEVVFYCNHDVEQTMEVFINRTEEFESHINLVKTFKLPLKFINKTKPQLSAIILQAHRKNHDDEFEISILDTLKVKQYKDIVSWYENPSNRDYKKSQKVVVAGVNHVFGWGGLHGAIDNYIDEGIFINSDVGSFYPALMIEYDFLSRNVLDKNKYKEIRDTRLIFKANKDPRQQPYKIVLNSTYGASKDKYNNLYDPRQANNVCVNGQLLLLDLIEKLEEQGFKLIQSNTDGVMFKLGSKADIPRYKAICAEWEQRTRMTLEHDCITKVIQKDVNNYIIVMEDGTIKSKGGYVKKLNELDYDLPIINKAVKDYFIKNIPVEQTINKAKYLIEFQKVVKISGKYSCGVHNNNKLSERVLRVFASKNNDGGIFKLKNDKTEKIAYTPPNCFIENGDIKGKRIVRRLDKSWYIDMAYKRINDFKGVE